MPWNSTTCSATTTAGNLLDLKYNLNFGVADNGNVLGITNNRDNTRSQSFTYDSLNRISTAQTQTSGVTIPNSNCWGYTFAYDPWGNLLQSFATGPSGCSEPYPQYSPVTTQNQISGYCYDSAGNLLDPGPCNTPHTYTYDAEDHLSSAGTTNYVYDGFGRRLWKSVTGMQCVYEVHPTGSICSKSLQYRWKNTTTLTSPIYEYGGNNLPIAEITPGTCTTFCTANVYNYHVFFEGQRIAKFDSLTGGIAYFLSDHLGSSRVATDSSSNILDDADFYPFGGERDVVVPSSGNAYKFTGYQYDSESGLDYASARHYNPALGRFMSPDLLSGSPGYPQSWNRYSYVMNNPLNLIDPTGMDADDPDCDPDDPCTSSNGNKPAPPASIADSSYAGYVAYGPLGGDSSLGSFLFGDPNNPVGWSVGWQIRATGSYAWNETKGVWDATGGGLYSMIRHPIDTAAGMMYLASALPNQSGYGGDIMAQMQIYDAAAAWGSKVAAGDPRAVGQAVGTAATLAYGAENLRIRSYPSGGGGINLYNTPTRGSRIAADWGGKWKGGSGFHFDVMIKRIPSGWRIWEEFSGEGSNWFRPLHHWQPWL